LGQKKLRENFAVITEAITKARPAATKGKIFTKALLCQVQWVLG